MHSCVAGFDEYFLGLRPALDLGDCRDPYASKGINCRNPWFRQFWSHHFHCQFEDQKESEMPPQLAGQTLRKCTGEERLTRYEQEGLVPFVGEYVH